MIMNKIKLEVKQENGVSLIVVYGRFWYVFRPRSWLGWCWRGMIATVAILFIFWQSLTRFHRFEEKP